MNYDDPVIALDDAAGQHSSGTRRWVGPVSAVVALILVIGGFAAWQFASGFGASTDSASAIPADAQVFFNIDLAVFTDGDQIETVADTFPGLFNEGGGTPEDVFSEFDEILREEADMTLADDVIPWVGRSAGIGMWGLDADFYSEEPSFVFALKVRDGEAADLFVERLAASQELSIVGVVEEVSVWGLADDSAVGQGFMARAGDMLLVASDEDSIRSAINTAAGTSPSLQDSQEFQDALASLPNGAGDTLLYFSAGLWEDAYGGLYADELFGFVSEEEAYDPFAAYGAGILSLSVVEEGIRLDGSIAFRGETLDQPEQQPTEFIPSDALFFVSSGYSTNADADESLFSAIPGLDETRQAIYDETGIDLVEDVVNPLNGSYGIYVRPGDGAGIEGVDIGGAIWLGLDDPARMEDSLRKIEDLLTGPDMGLAVTTGTLNSVEFGDGTPPFVYGVVDDWLTMAWNTDPISDSEGPSIVDTDSYKELSAGLGGELFSFVDIGGLIERFADGADPDLIGDLSPLRQLGVSLNFADDRFTGSMLMLIDWAE